MPKVRILEIFVYKCLSRPSIRKVCSVHFLRLQKFVVCAVLLLQKFVVSAFSLQKFQVPAS